MKLLKVLFFLIISFSSSAGVEYKKFDTPQQEEAYKILIAELRCLVCQNQTIGDSNASLAQDLRRQVYEMLQQGKTKDEIAKYMTDRYGDFVLYNPPFKAKTGLLWVGPVIFLIIGLVILIIFTRKKRATEAVSSTGEEDLKTTENKARIRALLKKRDQS